MKTSYVFLIGVITALICGCATHATQAASSSSLCELADFSKQDAGKKVRVSAKYFSDFRHGAYLSDDKCPSFSLKIGVDSPSPDDVSLAKFNEVTGANFKYYRGKKFSVEVSGTFEWEDERVINPDLDASKQLKIPARGVISLEKVWSFEPPER